MHLPDEHLGALGPRGDPLAGAARDAHRVTRRQVACTLEGAGPLGTGDAVRLTATGGQKLTATQDAEVLVWEMHATIAA